MNIFEKCFGGHISIGKSITVYGFNAMHVAVNINTKWGFVCFHPPMKCYGKWWPWYLYISPNGTPTYATWGIGPGYYA